MDPATTPTTDSPNTTPQVGETETPKARGGFSKVRGAVARPFRKLLAKRHGNLIMVAGIFAVIGVGAVVLSFAETITYGLWADTDVPKTVAVTDTKSVELGLKFQSKVEGQVKGVKFYKSAQNTGTHTGTLWNANGSQLANVTFTNESASGWQYATFAQPVDIMPNTIYVVSYHAPKGRYSQDLSYFKKSGRTVKDLVALKSGFAGPNGVLSYGAATVFPSRNVQASNFWVDVQFAPKSVEVPTGPSAPANLSATAATGSVALTWSASTGPNAIAKYTVFRDGSKLADITGATNYTDAAVIAGTTYSYQVQATDSQGLTSALSNSASASVPGGQTSGSWPAAPPAQVCGNAAILNGGPTSAPAGAIAVPAGDNSSMNLDQAGATYWFAPGVHTLGTDMYAQITPGDNSTYIGAPGAVIDGQNKNNYAFTQHATNVTIRYLTIRNFIAPRDEGVVNHDAGSNWIVEYSTISNNKGAGLMMGADNIYRYDCIKDNGQYAINACCDLNDSTATEAANLVLDHNEIVGNNTDNWEAQIEGCGCTGGVKFWLTNNVTVTNNWIHHNHGTGLWMDNNNRGVRIENNYINDNDSNGVMAEAGYDFQIRYNNFKNNSLVDCKPSTSNCQGFPSGAIYVSESGSPVGYGIRYVPSTISYNNFDNNWGGVILWENADRYSGSSAHTHVSGTIKIGDLYHDTLCNGPNDTIPSSIGDKFKCRWSTENVIVENNTFRIDKTAIGCAGNQWCGLQAIFSNAGTYPEFSGFQIGWRITFQQGNIFRNNTYKGDWKFNGWEMGHIVSWTNWRAAAPAVPTDTNSYNPPSTFGQDAGSTLTTTP